MAAKDGSHPSRYVKLGREQDDAPADAEDVRPGELNLPVRVPQLEVKRCDVCRQVLPEGYQAPADEEWTTGIFGCAEDPRAVGLGYYVLACCLDVMLRPLQESHGQELALATLSALKVALHWLS